jgi:hypothetical protein
VSIEHPARVFAAGGFERSAERSRGAAGPQFTRIRASQSWSASCSSSKTAMNHDHSSWKTRCVAVALLASGCATGQARMDTYAPIEKRAAFLGTSYEQDGKPLAGDAMTDALAREPAARDDVSTYKTLSTIALVAAGVGGALIGWPLGEAATGKKDPMWELAAVGGGLFVVSIPLGIVAANNLDSAVDEHNRRFGDRGEP